MRVFNEMDVVSVYEIHPIQLLDYSGILLKYYGNEITQDCPLFIVGGRCSEAIVVFQWSSDSHNGMLHRRRRILLSSGRVIA